MDVFFQAFSSCHAFKQVARPAANDELCMDSKGLSERKIPCMRFNALLRSSVRLMCQGG